MYIFMYTYICIYIYICIGEHIHMYIKTTHDTCTINARKHNYMHMHVCIYTYIGAIYVCGREIFDFIRV